MSDHCHGSAEEDGEITSPEGDSQEKPAERTPHINYLPPEVLTRIFAIVNFNPPTSLSSLQSLAEYSIPQTLVLAMVCRHWQNLTFSAPQFWTEIIVHIPPDLRSEGGEKKAARINDWLERSGVVALSLFIHYRRRPVSNPPPAPWDDPARPIWEVIERHADRFEAIHYEDTRVPLTRFLSFTSPSWSGLRYLRFHDHSAQFRFIRAVPWTQLTHIHIQSTRCTQLLFDILRHCPSLIELHFSSSSPFPSPLPPIIRNNLRRLTAHLVNLDHFFSAITLPSLEELRLSICFGVHTSADQLVAFLQRSSCKLNTLILTDVVLSSDGMFSVLEQESCQSLTGLAIDYFWNIRANPFQRGLIQRLTIGPSNASPLCPNLLFLRLGPFQGGSLDTLVDMVESRLCRTQETRICYMVLKVILETDCKEHLTDAAKRNGATSICVKTLDWFTVTFQAYTTCNHPF